MPDPATAAPHPYRLGFAVRVLGGGALASSDTRRRRSGPHLSRSLDPLEPVLDHLRAEDVRVSRMASGLVPDGTHPDLPELDCRRQIGAGAAPPAGRAGGAAA